MIHTLIIFKVDHFFNSNRHRESFVWCQSLNKKWLKLHYYFLISGKIFKIKDDIPGKIKCYGLNHKINILMNLKMKIFKKKKSNYHNDFLLVQSYCSIVRDDRGLWPLFGKDKRCRRCALQVYEIIKSCSHM